MLTAEAPISFQAGVRPTLADVYARHIRTVVAWAARLGGAGIDPEDVAHDVFVTAGRNLSRLAGDEHLEVWLFTLTRNQVRNRRRQLRGRKFLLGLWGRGLSGEDPRPLPPDAMERAATAALVRTALDCLSGDPFKDTSSVAMNPIIKFTTLFGLLAVELAIELPQSTSLALSAVFFVGSVIFIWRSFYGMRIKVGEDAKVKSTAKATA